MRYRAAAVVLALAAAVAIGQVPMYSDYPWGLLNNGVDQGPVYNLNCKPPLWCSIPSTGDGVIQLGDGGTLPIIVAYAMDSGFANSAAVADLALYARDSGFADLSAQSFFAFDAGFAYTSGSAGTAGYAFDAGQANYAPTAGYAASAGTATTALTADVAAYAFDAGRANYADTAGTAAYALDAGQANYAPTAGAAATAGTAAYALDAGRANYADSAGTAGAAAVATYALDAGNVVCLGCIVADRIGLAAVIREKIQAGAVNHTVIEDGGILGNNIIPGGVTSTQIATGGVATANIAAGAVTANEIGALAVTEAKINTGAVTNTKLGDLAVSTGKLQDLAVSTGKLNDLAVTEGKIGALAVTNGKLGDLSISTGKLQDLAVSTGKLNDLAVTEGKLGALSVTEGKIGALAVTNGKIGALAVDSAKLAAAAVTTAKIATGAVTANEIGAFAVTEAKIETGAVTVNKIGTGAVVESKIDTGAVTDMKLATGAVTEPKIFASAVTEGKLATGAVTVNKLGTGAVTTVKIADSNVTTAKVATNAITYPKLDNGAPLMAWDEGRGYLLSSRVTYTGNGTNVSESNSPYAVWNVTAGTDNFYVDTDIQFRAGKERYVTVTYRTGSSTGWEPSSTMTIYNMGAYAQVAQATMYADGAWHTAIFDISAWTGTNTIRLDAQDGGAKITTGASFYLAHVATGTVGPGAGGGNALVSYRDNVGVGTASPGSKTHVVVGNVDGLRVQSSNSGYLEVGKTSGQRWRWANDYTASNLLELLTGASGAAPGTSLLTVTSGGNVGIGTTNPGAYGEKLQVAGAASSQSSMMLLNPGVGSMQIGVPAGSSTVRIVNTYSDGLLANGKGIDITSGGNVGIGLTSGLNGNSKLYVAGDISLTSGGGLINNAYYDTAFKYSANGYASIVSQSSSNGNIVFQTAGNNTGGAGAACTMTERLSISNGGNVDVASFGQPGSESHVCSSTAGVLVICGGSDERIKENIEPLSSTLRMVLQMRPVRFAWKDKENMGAGPEIGFIAQEMMGVVPEVVGVGPKGTYLIHYEKLVAVLAGAIQELYEDRTWLARRVQALEDKAEATEKRLADLEARLAKLEAK